jgi:hypothetical protein
LQLRNLQSLVEIGVDKNTTVVFPAPLRSTINELTAFLRREHAASSDRAAVGPVQTNGGIATSEVPAGRSNHHFRRRR